MARIYGGYDIDKLGDPVIPPEMVRGGYDVPKIGGDIAFDKRDDLFSPEGPELRQPSSPSAFAGMAPPAPQPVAPTSQVAPSITPQTVPFAQGVADAMAPETRPLFPNTQAPIGGNLQQFPTPSGGTVGLPPTTPSGRTAQEIQGAVAGTALDERGYTPEEAKKFEQESFMAQKKQNMAERRIVGALEKQGMTEAEMRTAIGADENPNMSRSQAFTKLKELQKKKQMQGADSRTAKQTEKIMGMDDPDAERFRALEDAWSGTGEDDLGQPLETYMNDSQRKEFGRLRGKVADGRAREGDFTRMENILKQATSKSGRAASKRDAETEQATIAQATKEAQTKEDKAWLEPRTAELAIINKQLKEYDDAKGDKAKAELMDTEQRRELLDRRGQIRGQITNRNQGGAESQQAPTQEQPATFNSVAEAEAAKLPAGTPVIIGGRQAIIR